MIDLGKFSEVLLDLHYTARYASPEKFEESALKLITGLIPFDKAWWGIMSRSDDGFILRRSTAYQLPSSFVPLWEETKAEDNVAREASICPDSTVFFDQPKLLETPGLAMLTGEHGITQALCTSHNLLYDKAFVFLSLYREKGGRSFTDRERELKQYLMPHLWAARKSNQLWQNTSQKTGVGRTKTGIALVDCQNRIVTAEKDFWDLNRKENLMKDNQEFSCVIKKWLAADANELKLRFTVLRKYPLGQLTIIVFRDKVAADLLTVRESSIAKSYINGQSYKEIAREMTISPATARAHIRTIYGKLDVRHKSGLSSIILDKNGLDESSEIIQRYERLSLDDDAHKFSQI